MTTTTLKRQLISDATGNPVGVILPWKEFVLVEKYLDEPAPVITDDEKLAQLENATNDPLFLADLEETMTAFSSVDAEGWEES